MDFVEFIDTTGRRAAIRPDAVVRVVAQHASELKNQTRIIDAQGETVVDFPYEDTLYALTIQTKPAKPKPPATAVPPKPAATATTGAPKQGQQQQQGQQQPQQGQQQGNDGS